MTQKTLISNSTEELAAFMRDLRETQEYRNAYDRLLQIYDQDSDRKHLEAKSALIREILPEIKVVGSTMESTSILPRHQDMKNAAAYSFLLFEHAKVDVFHYDRHAMDMAEAGRRFKRAIRYKDHVAVVLLLTAGVMLDVNLFLDTIADLPVPVIGIEAGGNGGHPCLFGDFFTDCGTAAIVFSGRSLHLHYSYDMGWKAIGKAMRVTEIDGNYCAASIDGMPAASIYQRYLGVEPDEYFVENVREFPLITTRGERQVARCPSGYDDKGRLQFIARIHEGDVVRLSYGNPRRLLEETRRHADAMREFSPQALFLFICENRVRFLEKLASMDVESYRSFMPQMAWARGFAAIMQDRMGGGVVNSAILSLGFREGITRGRHGDPGADIPSVPVRKGAIPLDQRLAMFLEQTTKELEEMAIAADAASAAKSEFLSNMSHEIRTPINAILGMNEMILRECDKDGVLEYAENIHVAGLSLLGIINDILDFSKIEAGKMDIVPEEYELTSVVNDLLNLMSHRAEEKGLALSVRLDPRLPHLLYGDEIRIKQILTNLLSNAIKYTERGSVELSIDHDKLSDREIALKVSVKDTGIGIRRKDREKLFMAFERFEKEYANKIEGTGLGLNITQRLLSLMGSHLSVESVYGEGSDFSFVLVQKVVDWEEIGENGLEEKNRQRQGKQRDTVFSAPTARILVVDDAPMNLAVIAGLLKRTEIKVDTASSGQECLALFEKQEYDLILLDHRMPGMDGMETLAALFKAFPERMRHTPVICLTANAMSGAKEIYLAAGFAEYLTKPVMAEELEEMLIRQIPKGKVVFRENTDTEKERDPWAELPLWIRELDFLDARKGLSYCGGTEEFLEALAIFAASIPGRVQDIRQCLAEEDWQSYTIKVHSLKSMARSIGAGELSDLAQSLENAGDHLDVAMIYEKTPILLQKYQAMSQPLAPILSSAEEPAGSDREREGSAGSDEEREESPTGQLPGRHQSQNQEQDRGRKQEQGPHREKEADADETQEDRQTARRHPGQEPCHGEELDSGETQGELRAQPSVLPPMTETLQTIVELCSYQDLDNVKMLLEMLEAYQLPGDYAETFGALKEAAKTGDWDKIRKIATVPPGVQG